MFGPLSLRRQTLKVAPWRLVARFRATGQVKCEPAPCLPLRAIPKICRKLQMSILIYSHCMHCMVLARNKQWKHWNTMRNGKCWQLETLDFGPHCHSLSQTIWQGWNLKLLTLRTLFLFLTLSSQQLLYQGDGTQHALHSTIPTPVSPARMGVQDAAGEQPPCPCSSAGAELGGPGLPRGAKSPTAAGKQCKWEHLSQPSRVTLLCASSAAHTCNGAVGSTQGHCHFFLPENSSFWFSSHQLWTLSW